jgi:hypothetical protein
MDSMFATTNACPNCGALMAADQRYCLQCGERRTGGGLRDALPRAQTPAPAAPKRDRMRLTPNSSFIAGVATLLIALGVGVLIGRSGDDGPARAATPQVVTVAGSAAGTGTTTDTTAAATTSANSKKKSRKKSSSADEVTDSTAQNAAATAKKNGVKLPPKVVKVGEKCETGAKGCEGGKFTGNFFGGG